jgi:8-oxo-dGTP pyrophosphatase MutT (NUDIX family)
MRDHERLRAQIATIIPVDEREKTSIAAALDRLDWPGDPYDQDQNEHHVTASAFVVSTRGVILHRHVRLGLWLQPGGHVDAGEEPEEAALRETLEETGLIASHREPPQLFHVDRHPGPRGHTHYDLRYVLLAPPLEPCPGPHESPEAYWFDFDSAARRCFPDLSNALEKLGQTVSGWNVTDFESE